MKKIFTLFFCSFFLSYSHGQIIISQIYGGGGNNGATFKYDYIELINLGTTSVNISGYSIQYAAATGTNWTSVTIPANKTIAARGYFLIQCGTSNTNSTAPNITPTPDATASAINLSTSSGKVAFVNNATALSGSCPFGYIDLLGFGTSTCYIGTAPAPGVSNNTSVTIRKDDGRTNNSDNSNDYTTGTPTPRNSDQVLPLQLLSFSATPKENTVAFNWKTANERNTHYFEIEQSFDGTTFKSIATIAAAGNSTTEKSYSYTGSLNPAITYYRLRSVDIDGKSTTSSIVKVAPSKTGFSLGNVYPIPAKNNVTVEWNSNRAGATSLVLTDMSGRTVRTINLQSVNGFNQYNLDVNAITAGQYFLRLKNAANQVQTIITKQ